MWAMVVLLPKGGGAYSCIGLVEVFWKMCSVVVNCRLKRTFILHNILHGIREGRWTGMEMMEANLAQQLAELAYKTLFRVILDVRKASESLDRERCLELLSG